MKYLDLNGYIGPRANDATEGYFETDDEGLIALIEQANIEGFAVATSLELFPKKEVAEQMMGALLSNPYLSAKNAAIAALAESQGSVTDAFAAFIKNRKNNGNDNQKDIEK